MNRNKLIEELNKKFPGCLATPSEDFDGTPGGIWFRGSEDLGLVGDYCEPREDVEKFLNKHGFRGEPYDAGTLMAWD